MSWRNCCRGRTELNDGEESEPLKRKRTASVSSARRRRCSICRLGLKECWRKSSKVFVETIALQSLLYGIGMLLSSLLNLVSFYALQMLSGLPFFPLDISLFGPIISNAIYILVLAVFLVKKRRIQSTACRAKAGILFVLTITVSNYVVVYYSIVVSSIFLADLAMVGMSSSIDISSTEDFQVYLNDFTMAMFQSCCVNRGWAQYDVPSCVSPERCIYSSVEPGVCSCYISPTFYFNSLLSMDNGYCLSIERSQTSSLVAPPRGFYGCGASIGNPVGSPNNFQANFAEYFKDSQIVTYWITLVLASSWSVTQIIGYGIRFYKYRQAHVIKKRREKRRAAILHFHSVNEEDVPKVESETALETVREEGDSGQAEEDDDELSVKHGNSIRNDGREQSGEDIEISKQSYSFAVV